MSYCLIIQPIHDAGKELLREEGIEIKMASAPDMTTVRREIGGAVACITRNAGLDRAAMEAAPRLLILGIHGIGTDPVAVDHAAKIGLPIAFTPFANIQSVAEYAVALMLSVARHVVTSDRAVRNVDGAYRYHTTLLEMHGKTLGIIGFGRIGRRTAEIAKAAFGMDVLVFEREIEPGLLESLGMRRAEQVDEVFATADVISLHLPLLHETRSFVGTREFGLMKPNAILVNTARGALIDEAALAEALNAERIAGAGLDVFETEPLAADHPLQQCAAAVLSPHVGGATEEALRRTAEEVAGNVIKALKGVSPPHLVDPSVWERRRLPSSVDVGAVRA